jgi:hypothetical protein
LTSPTMDSSFKRLCYRTLATATNPPPPNRPAISLAPSIARGLPDTLILLRAANPVL